MALSGPVAKPEQFDANAPHRPHEPSPPRAGSKLIHTFNFMQTERFLTQRLIFGWETLRTGRPNKGEDVA
jgi:hypothetical protein